MKPFKAWRSYEYEERASWILENLTEYYNEENDKFETKLYGLSICNGCYAIAFDYSKCHIEELKSNIRIMGIISEIFDVQCRGRSSAVHGNIVFVPQTGLGMQAIESVFQKYVQESGCTQPHKQCQRLNDKTMVPLILLPMNTRREDVFHAVNCRCTKDYDEQSTRILFVLPYVAHVVHSCSNPASFPILKMPNLLEVSDMLRG